MSFQVAQPLSTFDLVFTAAKTLAEKSKDHTIDVSMVSSFTGLANTIVIDSIRELAQAGAKITIDNSHIKVDASEYAARSGFLVRS